MITFESCVKLIQSVDELPQWEGAKLVYADFETTSGSEFLDSLNPHHHCAVALIAVTVDECPDILAIPYMHFSDADKDIIQQWFGGILYECDEWVNHNVKYDAHVAANDLGLYPTCRLVCTLTQAKIIDSDRITRGGYSLDALSLSWLGEDISRYYQSLQPYIRKGKNIVNKDYGRIPPDILGEYAGVQVGANRRLKKYIDFKMPEQCKAVAENEIELTRNLWQMERNGLRVDMDELKLAQFKVLNNLCKLDDKLTQIVGSSFNPRSTDDMYDVLCVKYGLPVLAYTKDDDGNDTTTPSFDKAAMAMYEAHPRAPKEVIKLIKEFKGDAQLNSLFIEPWQGLAIFDQALDAWLLRSQYNQCVRTGRMSCSDPNAQQLSGRAKLLIHPKRGYAFISADYSQIEFRFIVHYINDAAAIAAYNENPDVDFHALVASWCEIPRKPAKNVNFGVAFGEGKRKLIKQLASNTDLVGKFVDMLKEMIATGQIKAEDETRVFNEMATRRGEQVYDRYHAQFPTLKRTMRAAESALKMRGYVFNIMGRHRHLPIKAAYRAFNTINQSSAADMMKERFNAVCRMIAGTPIETSANVHDELLLQAPIDIAYDPRTIRDIVLLLENPPIKIAVPIRCSVGVSADNWKAAGVEGETKEPRAYKALLENRDFSQFGNLSHLR